MSACIVSAMVGAGCATQVTHELPIVDASKVKVFVEQGAPTTGQDAAEDTFEVSGAWRRSLEPFERQEVVLAAARPAGAAGGTAPATSAARPPTAVERLAARSTPTPPPRPQMKAPKARSKRPLRPEGKRQSKSGPRLARDHYLDYPTSVVAQRITFYCPADCANEIRLKADDVRQTHPTRRLARGNARLVCRELTLEADRLTVRIREEPDADLQVSARGAAGIVSTVRGQVQREEGLRSMLITNDRLVPLR